MTWRNGGSRATPDAAVERFAAVARPIILKYFGRRSCIASSRIAIEVLSRFGVDVRPVPVRFSVHIPALEIMYCAGFSAEERAGRAAGVNGKWVELPIRGWVGHLIVASDSCLIDPSFDQGFDALAGEGHPVDASPRITVYPLHPDFRFGEGGYFCGTWAAVMDDGLNVKIEYEALDDYTFETTPAWETDHLQPVIREIVAAMEGAA